MAPRSNGNGEGGESSARMSLSLDPSIRRKIRLAAAIADMDPGPWCAAILDRAADKAVEDLKGKVKL